MHLFLNLMREKISLFLRLKKHTRDTLKGSDKKMDGMGRLGRFSPDVVARLEATRLSLAAADRFAGQLDMSLARLARDNPAVSATPVGIAWRDLEVRARIWRLQIVGEIDALLDGNEEAADVRRRSEEIMRSVVHQYLEVLIEAGEGVLRRG
jgi:hypothetical protein